MRNLLDGAAPSWLQLAEQQQYFRLVLPIVVAVTIVFIFRLVTEEDPLQRAIALIHADQLLLGYRRFTPARRWFSAFTLSLLEAQSVVKSDGSQSEVLDLDAIGAESELLDHLGEYADSEEIRNLQGLVSHFRREMLTEAGDNGAPGLAETWVGFGSQNCAGVGPLKETETTLRIYNAEDLGHQLISRTVTRGIAPGFGLGQRPVAFISIGREEPTPSEVERSLKDLEGVESVRVGKAKLVRSLLRAGCDHSVQGATPERLVEAIQGSSRSVGVLGETSAWTTDSSDIRWNRSWSETTLVSSGPAERLPQEGPALAV